MLMLAAAAVVAVVASGGSGGGGATARAATTVTITARDFFWSPDTVSIQVDDTVVWRNEQGFHNVVLGNDDRVNQPGFPDDPAWTNPVPERQFKTPGSYTFFCEVHPAMTGTINVEGGGTPPPTPTPTPTPPPAVPPPGSGPADKTAPTISDLSVFGLDARVQVRLTLSERSTVNARFISDADTATMRRQVEHGTWTLDRELAAGTYAYELWAVDAMGNRSSTHTGEVRVRG